MASTAAGIPERNEGAQVTDRTRRPEGVVSRRSQQYVIVGIAVVIVMIAMFSGSRQRKPASSVSSDLVPMVREGNEQKVSKYGNELAEEQRRALTQLPPPSNPASTAVRGSGQQSPYPQDNYSSVAPQPERDPLVERERELAFRSRFESNIAFAAAPPTASSDRMPSSAEAAPATVGEATATGAADGIPKKRVNVNVNAASGQPFVLFEGSIIETALAIRLDGDFSGPVKVMVTNPVYSHDHQHVLVPEGSNVLGEVKAVQGLGQRRLAVIFHRLIMPDGYSVDLDQFKGLNQLGETGLKDQVNNHYLQIFGTSLALGVIAGSAEASASSAGFNQSGSEAYRAGVASSLSQSATHILDRFLNIPPTLTIREGHRVKVYLTNDLLLPAYENHTIPPDI